MKIIYCIVCLLLTATTTVFPRSNDSVANDRSDLANPFLVNKFYETNNENLFWFNSSGELRKELITIINNACFLGLDKSNYHAIQLNETIPDNESDSLRLTYLDRIYTDAFISFCKDIYEGFDLGALIRFDALSAKNADKDNALILASLKSVKTSSDLGSVIKSLQPQDSYYKTLKSELSSQIALNNTDKIKQLNTALNLYRWIQHFSFDRYIVINAGSASLRYYEHKAEKLFSKVIVGKPSTRTPRFAAYCNETIFYPYWNVPRSIAVKELLPHFKRSPAAIDAMNMEIIDRNGNVINPNSINWHKYNKSNFPYSFRQQTGCDNSLGVIKFNLSDPFDVYLHDTNAKKLFESKYRYYSHGCIRIEKAIELGNLLLENKIDDNYLISCLKDQKPIPVQLEKPVPVFVIYATAEVDDQGMVQYNKDVYHLFR